MTDIVERLSFDATRCELQFSKGVAGNIKEAANEIERLRAALREAVNIAAGSGADFTWKANERLTGLRQIADGLNEPIPPR